MVTLLKERRILGIPLSFILIAGLVTPLIVLSVWSDSDPQNPAPDKNSVRMPLTPAESQKKRDDDAQMYSYWPTTIRVDTDMDSFWLNKEERTCQTYPDQQGRIAVVACNAGESHRDHNIPVKFWGGVDQNTVSNWKCAREGDEFACRAID